MGWNMAKTTIFAHGQGRSLCFLSPIYSVLMGSYPARFEELEICRAFFRGTRARTIGNPEVYPVNNRAWKYNGVRVGFPLFQKVNRPLASSDWFHARRV